MMPPPMTPTRMPTAEPPLPVVARRDSPELSPDVIAELEQPVGQGSPFCRSEVAAKLIDRRGPDEHRVDERSAEEPPKREFDERESLRARGLAQTLDCVELLLVPVATPVLLLGEPGPGERRRAQSV